MANQTNNEIKFMNIALNQANRVVGLTLPNPSVGCVVVKNGKIIAAAHTSKNGRPHAEKNAIENAIENVEGADLYVTLEPCAHYGKTPPCAELIVKSKIKRVFIANKDPNPLVNGGGIKILKDAGIEVFEDICKQEALEINYPFFKRITKNLPYVTLKMAISADNKIAYPTKKNKWITGELSRKYVHLIRARNEAILIGTNTLKKDNPMLGCRLPEMYEYSPIRVVLDKGLDVFKNSNIFQSADRIRTIVFSDSKEKIENVEIINSPKHEGNYSFQEILKTLADFGISRLMVEGGAVIAKKMLEENLIDEINLFSSSKIIGDKGLDSGLDLDFIKNKFHLTEERFFEEDRFEIFKLPI